MGRFYRTIKVIRPFGPEPLPFKYYSNVPPFPLFLLRLLFLLSVSPSPSHSSVLLPYSEVFSFPHQAFALHALVHRYSQCDFLSVVLFVSNYIYTLSLVSRSFRCYYHFHYFRSAMSAELVDVLFIIICRRVCGTFINKAFHHNTFQSYISQTSVVH